MFWIVQQRSHFQLNPSMSAICFEPLSMAMTVWPCIILSRLLNALKVIILNDWTQHKYFRKKQIKTKQSKTHRSLALLSEIENQLGCSWWECEWTGAVMRIPRCFWNKLHCETSPMHRGGRGEHSHNWRFSFVCFCPSQMENIFQWSTWKLDIWRPKGHLKDVRPSDVQFPGKAVCELWGEELAAAKGL